MSVINNPSSIKKITFELTSHCNLHCPQCSRFDSQGFQNKYLKLEHLNFRQIEKKLCVDHLSQLQDIVFEGDHGDALMHPDIEYILDFFSNYNKMLVTNGSLRNTTWWKNIAKIKNLVVTFSIDGIDQETNSVYRINSNFQKIINNATAFIEAGGTAVWKYIAFKHNEQHLEQARSLSQQLKFSKFEFQKSTRNFYDTKLWPIYVDGIQRGLLEPAADLAARKNTPSIAISNLTENFTAPLCKWGSTGRIYIDHRASIIPCCMTSGLTWRNDLNGKLWQRLIGDTASINLYHNNLIDILQSEFYNKTLQESFADKNRVHHVCLGNCANLK